MTQPQVDRPRHEPQRRTLGIVPSLSLALVLALGLEAVFVFGGTWLVYVANALRPHSTPESEWLHYDWQGQPVIVRQPPDDALVNEFRTLDDVPLANPVLRYDVPTLIGANRQFVPWLAPLPWRLRVQGFAVGRDQNWYLVHDGRVEGSAYFVGYQDKSERCLGYLGRQGFQSEVPEYGQRFAIRGGRMLSAYGEHSAIPYVQQNVEGHEPSAPGEILDAQGKPRDVVLPVLADDGLYEVNLSRQSVRQALELRDGVAVTEFGRPATLPAADSTPVPLPAGPDYRAIRTRGALLLLENSEANEAAPRVTRYPLPEGLDDKPLRLVPQLDNRLLVDTLEQAAGANVYQMYWLTEDAAEFEQREVRLKSSYWPAEPHHVWPGVAAAFPGAISLAVGATLVQPLARYAAWERVEFRQGVVEAWSAAWPYFVGLLLLGVALGVWVIRHQRAQGVQGVTAWIWAAFVGLLGIAGLLGYLAHRRWAIRETCAQCARRVPGDVECCVSCGAPFPGPSPLGIEILC